MPKEIDIKITPEKRDSPEAISAAIVQQHPETSYSSYKIIRRSIDARQKSVKYQLRVEIYQDDEPQPEMGNVLPKSNVKDAIYRVVIIGAGPAGLFAALKAIELGMKPIIIERGKNIRDRRRDLAAINKNHLVNSESNYCFGEGGAGTYSDGKLYTRSTKRGDVQSVFQKLVQFGASQEILIDAHPHIGTNKLPGIIQSIREFILECGGEIHFNTKMVDFVLADNKIDSIICSDGSVIRGDAYILATGHSARDIFELFYKKSLLIEFKPFALGVRAEHQQSVIDAVQYHRAIRSEFLPPASYSLVEQVDGRGVYSFCMCPGGIIAPCATSKEEIVTNGWSPSKRNNPWANSGIVVPVHWEDLTDYHHHGALAGMMFQKEVERKCWEAGGKSQIAPAQRMIDFVQNRLSKDLPEVSYQPGIVSVRIDDVLPNFIVDRLRKGFVLFGKKMKGYLTNDAVLLATESRTSSPVRIPRGKEFLHHPQIVNLYPCGEGAGYAGGIASAAIDGEKVSEAIFNSIKK